MNTLREVLRDFRAARTRAALTALSMFLAIASIIAIICASAVARDVFVAQEEQANGRAPTLTVTLQQQDLSARDLNGILTAMNTRVAAKSGAYAVQVSIDGRAGTTRTLTSGRVLPQGAVYGVAGRLDHVRRLPMLSGRWLRDDRTVFPAEVVENQAAAREQGGVGTVIAVQTAWHGEPYLARVIGVIADGTATPAFYTSLTSILAFDPGALDGAAPAQLLVHAPGSEQRGRTMLAAVLADVGVDPSTIDITRNDHVAQLAHRLADQQRGFLIACLVALAIAIVGLVNIGLANVRERSRELVVRRALGATRSRLFALVLLSTMLISLLTCAVSVGLAVAGVDVAVPHFLSKASAVAPPTFPWVAALAGLAAAVVGAAAGATYPAAVAARMDVAQALRD